MHNLGIAAPDTDVRRLLTEITRLNRLVTVLMDRAERSTSGQTSDFSLFQTTIVFEDQVRARTRELAAALHEVQTLQEQLREQAIRDPLTGLYNRRYMDDLLERELARAERRPEPLCVVMGDLDHFKAINDTYGHGAGDEVLRTFAGLIKRKSRRTDIAFRYGGEEFLLLLPAVALKETIVRIGQLRSAIDTSSVAYEAARIHVTASFGIASFPAHGRTGAELIRAADCALYAAKVAGRNRVVAYAGVKREEPVHSRFLGAEGRSAPPRERSA